MLAAGLSTQCGESLEGGYIAFSLNNEGTRYSDLAYLEASATGIELGAARLTSEKSDALVLTSKNTSGGDPWAGPFEAELMFEVGAARKYQGSGLDITFTKKSGPGGFVEGLFANIELTRTTDPGDTITLSGGTFKVKWMD